MSAGPRLRAGLTDVPVIGIPTRWTVVRDSPIAIPANPAGATLLVAPKMTIRKMKVSITSAINPETMENSPGEAASYTFCPRPSVAMV